MATNDDQPPAPIPFPSLSFSAPSMQQSTTYGTDIEAEEEIISPITIVKHIANNSLSSASSHSNSIVHTSSPTLHSMEDLFKQQQEQNQSKIKLFSPSANYNNNNTYSSLTSQNDYKSNNHTQKQIINGVKPVTIIKRKDTVLNEAIFSSTIKELMVECSSPLKLFDKLREICINLKKDNLFPITLDCSTAILSSDANINSFLLLLGFIKNINANKWICYYNNRIPIKMINIAISELHKYSSKINTTKLTVNIIKVQRQRSLNKQKSVYLTKLDLSDLTSLSPIQSHTSVSYDDIKYDDVTDPDRVQLSELMWSITHNNNNDHTAADVLLLCYPLVTDPKKLFKVCEARMFTDDHDGRISASNSSQLSHSSSSLPSLQSSTNSIFDRVLSSFSVQIKVIEFLKKWMNRYWIYDWNNNSKLIKSATIFIKRYENAVQNDVDNLDQNEIQRALKLINMLTKTISIQSMKQKMKLKNQLSQSNDNNTTKIEKEKKKTKNKNKNKNKRPKSPSKRGSLMKRISGKLKKTSSKRAINPSDALSVDYRILAQQITYFQFKLFRKIHHRECLKQKYKTNGKAPNVVEFNESVNKMTKWIQGSILLAPDVKHRIKVIKKWINVCSELYELKNFQGLVAVYTALQSTPIFKLKTAWSYIDDKQFQKIKKEMDSSDGYRNLRELQAKSHPPLLPYYGLYSRNLTNLEQITNKRNNDNTINWDSFTKLYTVIDAYLIYQNTPFKDINEDIIVQKWMKKELETSFKITDDFLYLISKQKEESDKQL